MVLNALLEFITIIYPTCEYNKIIGQILRRKNFL